MPAFTSMNESIETISGRLLNGCYDLYPFYQRGAVWDTARKQLLIDSIMNDIAVPPIYLRRINEVTDDDNNPHTHECLDGKQRLLAIKDFLQNRYGLENGITFDKMAPKDRRAFLMKHITIIEYMNLDDDEILEIFSRVNNGMTLTQGELIRGMNTSIRRVMTRFENEKKEMVTLIKTKRNAAFEIYIRCLFLEFHEGLRSTNADVIRAFVRDEEKKITEELLKRFEVNMDKYLDFLIRNGDVIRATGQYINKFKFSLGYYGLTHLQQGEDVVLNFLQKYDVKHASMGLKEMTAAETKWFPRV
jgi:hypothetical protein